MSVWITAIQAAAFVNVILLLGLGAVWGRNYVEYRSKYTLALVMFVLFLLIENVLSLYMYLLDPNLSTWLASDYTPTYGLQAMMGLHVLETAGLSFLAWSTWD